MALYVPRLAPDQIAHLQADMEGCTNPNEHVIRRAQARVVKTITTQGRDRQKCLAKIIEDGSRPILERVAAARELGLPKPVVEWRQRALVSAVVELPNVNKRIIMRREGTVVETTS